MSFIFNAKSSTFIISDSQSERTFNNVLANIYFYELVLANYSINNQNTFAFDYVIVVPSH